MKILELFSGYGTSSFALKRLNIPYELVEYSDIDKNANEFFKENHCASDENNKLRLGDVRLINPEDLEDFDLLTGGFPCQDFSIAGKQLGELGPRGTLFYEIIRIAEIKRPRYMLLENVKGLTHKKFKGTFDKILSELDRIGYNVYWKVLNSKDYGTPQSRNRLWFVCFRKDIDKKDFNFPDAVELKIFLKDLLDDLPFREIPRFQFGKYGDRDRLLKLKTTNDLCFHTLTTKRTHADQYLLNPERTMCRNFTKKESFRLMGFKDEELSLSDNQSHRLAGNGQDINVVTKLLSQMLK